MLDTQTRVKHQINNQINLVSDEMAEIVTTSRTIVLYPADARSQSCNLYVCLVSNAFALVFIDDRLQYMIRATL